ncbi:unnamed protein product, partial [Sphagnum balticum]
HPPPPPPPPPPPFFFFWLYIAKMLGESSFIDMVEVMEYSSLGKRDRDMSSYEAQEAARVGIDSARRLLQMLSHQHQEQQQQQQQQQCLQEAGGHGKERMMSAADAERCKFQKLQ